MKDNRYLVYNSSYSRLRVLNERAKKVLVRVRLEKDKRDLLKRNEESEFTGHSLDEFCLDEERGMVWYSYTNDEHIYIYSLYHRKRMHVLPIYDPNLRKQSIYSIINLFKTRMMFLL